MAKPPRKPPRAKAKVEAEPATPAPKPARKRPSTGNPRGRPAFKPSAVQKDQVELLAAVGTPYPIIAEELGISEDTLTRHFRVELDRGLARINARIGGGIASQALRGDGPSQRFWMKTRGGWKEGLQLEHSGPDGAPIQTSESFRPEDFSHLSIEKRKQLRRLLAEAEAGAVDAKE